MTTYGYLELPYMTDDYLSVTETHNIGVQVTRVINVEHLVNSQTKRMIVDALHGVSSEVDRQTSGSHVVGAQAITTINAADSVNAQVERLFDAVAHDVGAQVDRRIVNSLKVKHAEVRRGNVVHENCEDGGYLMLPYLSEPYLAGVICAGMRTQVDRIVGEAHAVNIQVNRNIVDAPHIVFSEIDRNIDALHNVGAQVTRVSGNTVHCQIIKVLYNIKNLRILQDFPSRGTGGTNWTANSTMAGDFSILNVNTDIVEQVWRSNTGTLSGLILTCDTGVPQGVFVDTLALLNHNLTTSAAVLWQGSDDPGFATTPLSVDLTIEEVNTYYIAPTLPLSGYRYHRFLISDPTNSNDFLQIGTIVFGSSIIFQGECFVDKVTKSTKHFADKVPTEAFSNVSNDRAIKFAVSLQFKNLDFNKDNYRNIRDVFDTARTSLKCLWIPTPEYPKRFATFAKLVAIPDEEHNVKGRDLDFIDFNITTDESL